VIRINVKEAEGHLGQLIEEAAAGQEVVITRPDGFTVQLVPLTSEDGTNPKPGKTVGHALDRFLGTWTAEEEAEFLGAVEVFGGTFARSRPSWGIPARLGAGRGAQMGGRRTWRGVGFP
jgi:antitoxin (DNA-binding transcriptional repressor) of toxin-antitoxin stability system